MNRFPFFVAGGEVGVEDAFKLGEGAEGLDGCLIGDVLAMGPSDFGSATASVAGTVVPLVEVVGEPSFS